MPGMKVAGWFLFEDTHTNLFEAYTKFAAGNLTERDMLLKLVHGEALSAAGMQQSIQQLYERMERLHQKIDRIEKKIGSVPAK